MTPPKSGRLAAPEPAPATGANRANRRGHIGVNVGPTAPAASLNRLPHRHACPKPEPLTYASTHGWALVKCPRCGAARMIR